MARKRGAQCDKRWQILAIAVTGMANAKDHEAALAAGFQAHVTKPIEPEALAATVSQWSAPDNAGGGASPVRPSPPP